MHGLFKINRIQYLDPIASIYQHLSAFYNDRSLWISTDITDIWSHLHKLRFQIEPRFSGT